MRSIQYASAEVAGGLLEHLCLLSEGLARSGNSVRAVLAPVTAVDPPARRCLSAGVAVSRLTVRGKFDFAGMIRFARLVAADRPQVVHVHLASPVEALPAILAARWGGARHIVTTEHAPTWRPLQRFYSRAAKRAAMRLLDATIVLSRADAVFLREEFGAPPSLLRVIHNGVPGFPAPISKVEARARLGLSPDATVVGYLGALEEKKGLLDLLEAVERSRLAALTLLFGGEGGLEPVLRDRSAGRDFPVVLAGRIADVGGFLAAVDVFVFPSHQEALPLALLEAMAAGLPIVATTVGGIPEAIEDGVSGLLVPPRQPDAVAGALRRLAADPALARRLGDEARRTALEKFGAERMIRATEALYAEILARDSGGGPAGRNSSD
jgi:glycosyltransferase involved in cell wall biosynthesis